MSSESTITSTCACAYSAYGTISLSRKPCRKGLLFFSLFCRSILERGLAFSLFFCRCFFFSVLFLAISLRVSTSPRLFCAFPPSLFPFSSLRSKDFIGPLRSYNLCPRPDFVADLMVYDNQVIKFYKRSGRIRCSMTAYNWQQCRLPMSSDAGAALLAPGLL